MNFYRLAFLLCVFLCTSCSSLVPYRYQALQSDEVLFEIKGRAAARPNVEEKVLPAASLKSVDALEVKSKTDSERLSISLQNTMNGYGAKRGQARYDSTFVDYNSCLIPLTNHKVLEVRKNLSAGETVVLCRFEDGVKVQSKHSAEVTIKNRKGNLAIYYVNDVKRRSHVPFTITIILDERELVFPADLKSLVTVFQGCSWGYMAGWEKKSKQTTFYSPNNSLPSMPTWKPPF